MPNLNPIITDQIDIDGNTFTLGATLPGTPSVGQITTNVTGLNPGISYYFAVVALNDISGYSGWAGPIVVYIQPEIRTAINAYSWNWPHGPLFYNPPGFNRDVNAPVTQYSNSSNNLFYLSNRTDLITVWGRSNMNSLNSNVSKFTGITPPFEGANVTAVNIKASGYYDIKQTVYDLIPGTTYTYSFYHNVDGMTGMLYRINTAPGLTALIRQIEPVDQGNFALDEWSLGGTNIRLLTYPTGGTGWKRFVSQFVTDLGQTYASFTIFASNVSNVGTAYIAAPQLSLGTAASDFVSTNVIANWEGICGDDDKWLAFGNSYGLTYIAPTINPVAELQVSTTSSNSQLIYFQGYAQNTSISRTAKLLKSLPENKRALLPTYLFSDDLWYYYNDSLDFASGNCFNFPVNLYDTIFSDQKYPTIWPVEGISYTKELWDPILSTLSATGATVDYLISNAEVYGLYGSFNWTTPGLTTAMSASSKYKESYLGLTAWETWLTSMGATISNIMNGTQDIYAGWSSGNFDYIVWDGINRAHELRAMDAVFTGVTLVYPNITLADYEWSLITDGSPIDAPPDLNGNPSYWQYHFGNAAAPQLYGWMGQIINNMGICGSNPTYLYFAPNSSGGVGPPNFGLAPGDTRPQKNAWTSFVMSLQTVRSSKRARPNLPITPWIASVKFKGQSQVYPGNTAERPQIGFADMNLGYNPQQGVTLTVAGGNSAYYYEMVRHVMLSGTKGLLYWNSSSFEDARIATGDNATNEYTLKFANGQGATGFIDDMQKLNDCVGDVNNKIGGFTLTTADASRISWLAPYVASGAPGPNGVTWWWRITTNPGNTTFVNGQTLSVANNNIVGTWVSTTGPTLAGVLITTSF